MACRAAVHAQGSHTMAFSANKEQAIHLEGLNKTCSTSLDNTETALHLPGRAHLLVCSAMAQGGPREAVELPMRSLRGQRFAQPWQVGTLGGKVKAVELHVTGERDANVCWKDQQACAVCSWQSAAPVICIHLCWAGWHDKDALNTCLTSASDGELRCRSTLVNHVGLGSPP